MPAVGIEFDAVLEIGVEVAIDHAHHIRVEHDEITLLVEAERPLIQVRRADGGESTVDRHDLCVQHRPRVGSEVDASIKELLVSPLRR